MQAIIVFEHGIGASDFYETTPEEVYALLHDICGLKLYTLKNFSGSKKPLTAVEFYDKFYKRKEYYFAAN